MPPWALEDLCILLKQFGYEGMEIALAPEHIAARGDEEYWERVFLAARGAEIPITCLHLGNPRLYADPNEARLAHPDAAKREFHLDLIRAAFEIAPLLECPLVATASGAPPEGGAEAAWGRMLETLRAAAALCPDECELLVEHEPEHLVATTQDILYLFDQTDGWVACNLDVGHLEVAGEPIGASIERLGEAIRNVHLEDIRGRRHQHLLPGDGQIDFAEAGAALKSVEYAGPMTADLYPFAAAPVQALKRAKLAFGGLMK